MEADIFEDVKGADVNFLFYWKTKWERGKVDTLVFGIWSSGGPLPLFGASLVNCPAYSTYLYLVFQDCQVFSLTKKNGT